MCGIRSYFSWYNSQSFYPCISKAAICLEAFIHETNNLFIPRLLFGLANVINDNKNSVPFFFFTLQFGIVNILNVNQSLEWIIYTSIFPPFASEESRCCTLQYLKARFFWRFCILVEQLHFNFRFSLVLESIWISKNLKTFVFNWEVLSYIL